MALSPGAPAPPIPGISFGDGPQVLFFYKVTCPVCQLAAPKMGAFAAAQPGRVTGIGQDPEEQLTEFGRRFGMGFPALPDLPPYDVSNAYAIRVVPTTFLVGEDGNVLDSVESWDREGLNRIAERLAGAIGSGYAPVSLPEDGLPSFRPG